MKKAKQVDQVGDGTVHFRPNHSTSALIRQLAEKEQLSHGEVCRRVTALALRGLTLFYYDMTRRLALYTDSSFEDAAQQLAVHIRGSGKAQAHTRYNLAHKFVERCRDMNGATPVTEYQITIQYKSRK